MMLKHSKPKVHSISFNHKVLKHAKSTKLSGGSFHKCHAYAILSPVPGYSDWIRPSHPKTPGQQQQLLTALERCPLFRGIDVEVTLAKITKMKTLPGLKNGMLGINIQACKLCPWDVQKVSISNGLQWHQDFHCFVVGPPHES